MKLSFFQIALLAVFGVSAIIGLIVFITAGPGAPKPGAIGTVVIWGTLPKDAMSHALNLASQTNTELKSVSYVAKPGATFTSDLTTAIAEGAGPDMVIITEEDLLSLERLLQPIPASTLAIRDFQSAFAQAGELFITPDNAGSYGVPFLIDPLIMYENRTILASSGVAEPPATWEALTGLTPRVVTKNAVGNISRGLIGFGTYNNIHNARAILSALMLQAGVPVSVIYANGNRTANLGTETSRGTPPGQAILRFYTQFADPTKISYTWNTSLPDSQQAFLAGDVALYLGFASEAAYVRDANPNLDFDVAPLPQPANATRKSTFGEVYAFAIPRGSSNPSGAYGAAVALVATDVEKAMAEATGLAPADRALLNSIPSAAIPAVAYTSALYAQSWLSPLPADTDRVFSAMINNVITGRLTLDAALANAESSLAALLQQ